MLRKDRAERIVEALVIAVSEIPEEPHLSDLFRKGHAVPTTSALRSSIVQDELRKLVGDEWLADEQDRNELAEILSVPQVPGQTGRRRNSVFFFHI